MNSTYFWTVIGSVAGVVGAATAAVFAVQSWRDQRSRKLVVNVQSRLKEGAVDQSQGRRRISDIEEVQRVNIDRGTEKVAPKVNAEDVRLFEYNASRRDAAERELASYLPDNPRRAKRLINHERLYATIAEDRGIFGGDPELNYRHLAKWVLIVEHWPRLGAALTRDPSGLAALESATTTDELQQELNATALSVRATDELLRVLHDEIALSPVIERLVRFESADTKTNKGSLSHAIIANLDDFCEAGGRLRICRTAGKMATKCDLGLV